MKTGIFYGSTYGNTQECAETLGQILGELLGETPEIFDIHSIKTARLLEYDLLLIGVSTWNDGQIQDDWDDRISAVESLDWSGRIVALFGCGDQVAYAETFADALGMVGESFQNAGATLVGKWPTAGYDFILSRADLGDGNFIGLPLDFDNQSDQTQARLKSWAAQLVSEVSAVSQT